MPPGIFPPLVLRYSASNVPILQVSLGSDTPQRAATVRSGHEQPAARNGHRSRAQIPYPYGGKLRQIMVDIDPEKLVAFNLSAADVSNAINAQNLIFPPAPPRSVSRNTTSGSTAAPRPSPAIGDLPIKTIGTRTIYIRDVAHVRDGFAPQTNVVHVDGKRGVLQPILKSGASTLDIVSGVKARLPALLKTMPESLE